MISDLQTIVFDINGHVAAAPSVLVNGTANNEQTSQEEIRHYHMIEDNFNIKSLEITDSVNRNGRGNADSLKVTQSDGVTNEIPPNDVSNDIILK